MEEARSFGHLLQLVRELPRSEGTPPSIRVAVGGPANVAILEPGLKYFLQVLGLSADVQAYPYESWSQGFSESPPPDYFILWTSTYGLTNGGLNLPEVDFGFLAGWIKRLEQFGSVVVAIPPEMSGFEDSSDSPFREARTGVNRLLAKNIRSPHVILPIDHLVQELGVEAWEPGPYWDHALYPIHPNSAVIVTKFLARLICNDVLSPIRAIAVDLDDTLWGGIVGEAGVSQLDLDERSTGRHFLRMQEWLQRKRSEGYLIGVISKNDATTAEDPFLNRQEMRLSLEQFDFFEASWSPKSTVLERVARRLNLDTSQFAFIDDSKHERDEMKTRLPSVCVPHIPEDPSRRVSFLNSSGLFSKLRVSETDRLRAVSYRALKVPDTSSVSLEEYLRSLEMELQVVPITQVEFGRSWELIQKTNQFNVSARRNSRTEFAEELRDSNLSVAFVMRDKLGNHGIVSVLVTGERPEGLELLHWVMSCRVFGRGVEWAIADYLSDYVRMGQIRSIFASVAETERNQPARQALRTLGFTPRSLAEGSIWDCETLSIPEHQIVLVG